MLDKKTRQNQPNTSPHVCEVSSTAKIHDMFGRYLYLVVSIRYYYVVEQDDYVYTKLPSSETVPKLSFFPHRSCDIQDEKENLVLNIHCWFFFKQKPVPRQYRLHQYQQQSNRSSKPDLVPNSFLWCQEQLQSQISISKQQWYPREELESTSVMTLAIVMVLIVLRQPIGPWPKIMVSNDRNI